MRSVACPVQVQWGEKDPWTTITSNVSTFFQRLAAERPGTVQFVRLPDTSHCPQDDRPDLVLAALQPFLDRIQPTSSS